jgi:hypothetical protein
MSEVAAPQPAQGFEGSTVKPWAKIAIWGAVGVGIAALAVLTTGNIPFLHRSQPHPEAAKVSMTGPVSPLVRPAQPVVAAASLPKVATPPLLAAVAPASNDDHTKAFESPIGVYQIKTNASTGVQTATNTGSGDIGTAHGLPADGTPDALEASLVPTKIDGTRVAELPDPRWLIEAGRLLSCVQVTKIDSTLPGAVTAIIPDAGAARPAMWCCCPRARGCSAPCSTRWSTDWIDWRCYGSTSRHRCCMTTGACRISSVSR